MQIESLGLHDATLVEIKVLWKERLCVLRLAMPSSVTSDLTFWNISAVNIPANQPWGPSVSINKTVTKDGGKYEIEMQSGDVLRITASNITFDPVATRQST
jgi:hypothetical protein